MSPTDDVLRFGARFNHAIAHSPGTEWRGSLSADVDTAGKNRLSGKRIVIAGGGTGIGRAAALLCAREGAKVVVIGRRYAPLEEVASAIGGSAFAADVRDAAAARGAIYHAARTLGGIDGLVNAVGVLDTSRIDDIDDANWTAVIANNLGATFLMCREALPSLRSSPSAAIVNIGALAAVVPGVASVAYSAAKAGVVQLSQVLAAQEAPGVRVNCVCPGAVDTDMTRSFLAEKTDAERIAFTARYACKRMALPDEIASLIVFLLSDEASYITGSNFIADGGRAYR